MLQVR